MTRFFNTIKIPTLFGFIVLLSICLIALLTFLYNKQVYLRLKIQFKPLNDQIKILNITENSVSVIWFSQIPSIGYLNWGANNFINLQLRDDRDIALPKHYLSHISTIKGLKGEKEYSVKVKNNNYIFPDKAIIFKTAPKLAVEKNLNKPLIGKVVSKNNEAVNDGLVFLKIPGANEIASLIGKEGSFLLSLAKLRSSDLSKPFIITSRQQASLEITNGREKSQVKIFISPLGTSLPTITLGQNLDLTLDQAVLSAKFSIFDINKDGLTDLGDLEVLKKDLGLDEKIESDLNLDGEVNQKDVEILQKALQ